MALRIAFLGTGRLAAPVFQSLCDSEFTVCGLVTQPDRTGPGHHRHSNPLKSLAEERGIPVLQPQRIKTPDSVESLRQLNAELFVVAAYGQILSREILDMPRLGTINVHASLLPRHRGATPIHAAVLEGDLESGITIIRLVPELDAGPMLGSVRTPIGRKETTGELEARLADLAPPPHIARDRGTGCGRRHSGRAGRRAGHACRQAVKSRWPDRLVATGSESRTARPRDAALAGPVHAASSAG